MLCATYLIAVIALNTLHLKRSLIMSGRIIKVDLLLMSRQALKALNLYARVYRERNRDRPLCVLRRAHTLQGGRVEVARDVCKGLREGVERLSRG
jgi:hypothetical protein